MVIKLNLNTALVVLGGLGVFAPDAAFIATWLNHWDIHWLTYVAKVFGFLATFFAAAPLVMPKLRAFLALFKLATPAGEVVTLPIPKAKKPRIDPDATPKPVRRDRRDSDATPKPFRKDRGFILPGRILILLGFSLLFLLAWLLPKYAKAEDSTASLPTPAVVPELPPIASPPPRVAPALAPEAPALSLAPTAASPTAAPEPGQTTLAPAPQPDLTPTVVPATPVPPAQHYDSRYGGCKGNFCLAPAFAIQAFQYVPSTGDMTGGVAFAGGYGLIWHTMIDLGLAFYGGVQFSRDKPFTAQGLAMFNIANYVAFGPGFEMLGQPSGPAKFHLTICFAANWIPGLVAPK